MSEVYVDSALRAKQRELERERAHNEILEGLVLEMKYVFRSRMQNQVCAWRAVDGLNITSCTETYAVLHRVGFKFCPYCGGAIQEVPA